MPGRRDQFSGTPKGACLGSQQPQYIHGYSHHKVKSQTESRSLGNSVHMALSPPPCKISCGSHVWSQLQDHREGLLPESCWAVHYKLMALGRWAGAGTATEMCPWPAEDYEGHIKRASTQASLVNIVKNDTCSFRHFWGIGEGLKPSLDSPQSQSPEIKRI